MNVIIISQQDHTAELVSQTLRNLGFDRISHTSSGSEARRLIRNTPTPDIVIINTPLSDEFGNELAEAAADETEAKIILLCQSDIADELADRLSAYDVLVLSKPMSRDSIIDGIRLLEADFSPLADVKESGEVLSRINDIRTVNKAKSVLMKYLHFTEPQAHRYLEKQAMNNRCTRRKAAEQIIKNYGK